MNILRKINFIFDRKQKTILVFLFLAILIGSFFELLGVSAILPLVNVVVDASILQTDENYKFVYNLLRMQSAQQFILTATIALIIIYVVKNVYMIFMYNLQFKFTFDNQKQIASRMMNYYVRQDYIYHLSKNSAELQRNITQDISMFSSTILSIIELFTEVFVGIMLVIFLMFTDITTTMVVTVLILIFTGIFYAIYKKIMVNWGKKYRQLNAQVIKWIQQSLGGIKELKILNREEFFLDAFNENYKNAMKYARRQKLIGALPKSVMESICICGLLATVAVRVGMGADMTKFIPTLSVFAIAAFRLLPSFNRITSYLSIITFNKSAIDAVYEELKEAHKHEKREDKKEAIQTITFNNSIQINHVKYKYPNTDTYVLEDINLTIERNKSTAFVGTSGSGKTTLVDLILGVLKPEAGQVMADGRSIHTNIDSWFKQIGYIPQTIYLMDDTIRNNVAFGIKNEDISEEKIWKALKMAQLDKYVNDLEKGIDTEIGEKGVRLSGGQRQRIGIARTLYNDPQILVLDEATSALDNETERAVMEAINNLKGFKTLIVIAHRLTTIADCDVIYEVNQGKVKKVAKNNLLR